MAAARRLRFILGCAVACVAGLTLLGVRALLASATKLEKLNEEVNRRGLDHPKRLNEVVRKDSTTFFRSASARFEAAEKSNPISKSVRWFDECTPSGLVLRSAVLQDTTEILDEARSTVGSRIDPTMSSTEIIDDSSPAMIGAYKSALWLMRRSVHYSDLGLFSMSLNDLDVIVSIANQCGATQTAAGDNSRQAILRRMANGLSAMLANQTWSRTDLKRLQTSLSAIEEAGNAESIIADQVSGCRFVSKLIPQILASLDASGCTPISWQEKLYGNTTVARADYLSKALDATLLVDDIRRSGNYNTLDGYREAVANQKRLDKTPLPCGWLEHYLPSPNLWIRRNLTTRVCRALMDGLIAVRLAQIEGGKAEMPPSPLDQSPLLVRNTDRGIVVVCPVAKIQDSEALGLEDFLLSCPPEQELIHLY